MKKIFKIVVPIIFLVLCTAIIFMLRTPSAKPSKESASPKNKPNISQNNDAVLKAPETELPSKEDPITLSPLTIEGFTKNYTAKQYESLNAWKKQITELTTNNSDKLFISGPTNRKAVSLTFDDGPSANVTPKILDILKENDVKASFFIIGSQIPGNSAIIKRMYEDGNLVLNHSYTHPELTKKNNEEITNELVKTETALQAIIGKKPAILRPPYGDLNQQDVDLISSLGYKSVIWSTDTFDWSQKEKDNIVKNVTDNLRSGEIILMHCNSDKIATAEALPQIIQAIKSKGYEITTLDKLLNIPAYK